MALFKLGPLIAGVSGSVGGTTFARNRAGYYGRQRTKPAQPVSLRRDAAQQIIGNLVQEWTNDFTSAERKVWTDAAAKVTLLNKLGEAYTPTGINLFVRCNTQLINTGQDEVLTPPVQAIAPTFAPTLKFDTDDGILIDSPAQFDPALVGYILLFTTINVRQSINFFKGPWHTMRPVDIAEIAVADYPVLDNTTLLDDTRAFFAFVAVLATGAVSARMITSVDVGTITPPIP